MSRKFFVTIQTTTSATVPVTISDSSLRQLAADLEKPVGELTIDDLEELITSSYSAPTICAQCSGCGSDYGLSLGEEWEISVWPSDAPFSTAVTEDLTK